MPRLMIVIASTRPGRVGPSVAAWLIERARAHGRFELDVADLAELDLPLIDEPNHPRLRNYTRQHTRDWSARVEAADAFVFVTPEYNYGAAPALLNALDYLFFEWAYKPASFVSYGGVSAGLRGVQAAKAVTATLRILAIAEAVSFPFVAKSIDADGRLNADEFADQSAEAMLDELHRVEAALRVLRA